MIDRIRPFIPIALLPILSACTTPLDREGAEAITDAIWQEWQSSERETLAAEIEAKAIVVGDHTLRLLEKRFGERP